MLEGLVDKVVQVITNDGRVIVGLLKGFDQTTNVILDECHERVFSGSTGVEQARSCRLMRSLCTLAATLR
jgi:U6 snRNA-associated Sm-like protein LSm8